MSFSTIVLLAGVAAMSHGVAPVGSGVVVAAPHEGFDDHTAPMARAIAEELECGWVVAENFRVPKEGRWLDVNRPTQRLPGADGRLAKGKETPKGRTTYAKYQALLLKVGKRKGGRLDLLVEIHGHARELRGVGKVQVIELATRGFDVPELQALDRRYRKLVRQELAREDRVQLAVEQLHASYEFKGHELGFYFRASVAKKKGSLSPGRTRRALHFELPQKVRFDPERRAAYARVLAKLLAPLR